MGGGPSLPTPSTPGYGTFTDTNTGRKFTGCYCTIQFLAAAERLGLARGLLKVGLDVVQLTGGAADSAGTHSLGAAFDVKQVSSAWVRIFRELGAAFWPRLDDPTRSDDLWDDNQHGHGVIDCAHDANCSYQFTAYWRGYSGLGQAKTGPYAGMWGYGSKDPDPWRPSTRRTWREGIAWADAETKRLTTPTPTPTPAPVPLSEEDELMAITVKNPLDGKQWSLPDALWSMWTYAYQASVDAKAALAVARVAAAKGEPLTEAETEAAVQDAIKGAVVNVTIGYPPAPDNTQEA